MTKKKLTEGLSDNISNSLKYVIFLDLYPMSKRTGGMSTIMFSNIDHRKLAKWLKGLDQTDTYTENEDALKDMYSRISVSSSLKDLYRTVDKLKSKETSSEENEQRISDIEMVMRKIQKTLKSKLSKQDLELFDKMSDLLDDPAESAAKSIEGSVGASTLEPEPEPEPEPEIEQDEVEESLKMEVYLKSVIREMLEKRLKLK
jgi:hypothetical protein